MNRIWKLQRQHRVSVAAMDQSLNEQSPPQQIPSPRINNIPSPPLQVADDDFDEGFGFAFAARMTGDAAVAAIMAAAAPAAVPPVRNGDERRRRHSSNEINITLCITSLWIFNDWRAVTLAFLIISCISQTIWFISVPRDDMYAYVALFYNCSVFGAGMLLLRAYLRVHAAFDPITRKIVKPFEVGSWVTGLSQLGIQIINSIVRSPFESSDENDLEIGGRVQRWYLITSIFLIVPMICGVIALTWWAMSSLRFVVKSAPKDVRQWSSVQRSAYRLMQLSRCTQILVLSQVVVQCITISLRNTVTSWYIVNGLSRTLLLAIPGVMAFGIQATGATVATTVGGAAIAGGQLAIQVRVQAPNAAAAVVVTPSAAVTSGQTNGERLSAPRLAFVTTNNNNQLSINVSLNKRTIPPLSPNRSTAATLIKPSNDTLTLPHQITSPNMNDMKQSFAHTNSNRTLTTNGSDLLSPSRHLLLSSPLHASSSIPMISPSSAIHAAVATPLAVVSAEVA